MTVLEQLCRKQERKQLVRRRRHSTFSKKYNKQINQALKDSSSSRSLWLSPWANKKKTTTTNRKAELLMQATPRIETSTLEIIRMEFDLLQWSSSNKKGNDTKQNSSIKNSIETTVLTFANALLGSRHVLDNHADTSAHRPKKTTTPRAGYFGSVMPKRRESRSSSGRMSLQLRYQLVNALNKLQQQTGASSTVLGSWDEAVSALSTVLELPPSSSSSSSSKANEATTTTTTTTTGSFEIQEYTRRLAEIRLRDSSIGMRVSQHKWQEIAQSAYSSSSLKNKVAVGDDLLAQQLQDSYEQRNANKEQQQQQQALDQVAQRMEQEQRQREARERAASLMRPISDEERERIRVAMEEGSDTEEVAANAETADSCQRKSLRTLTPGEWLNDEVIHYFLVMLQKRDQQLVATGQRKHRSHFFKSFFVTKLRNEGSATCDGVYEYRNVKRWSKKVPGKDIFKLDKVFFPINQNQMHWTSAVAFMQAKKIQFFDSMGGDGKKYLRDLFRYIQDEHMDKKKCPLPNADEWELIPCTRDTPVQRNGYDCGVFTCMFADFLSMDCPLVFGQDHITQCRERIALSILNGQAIV